MKQKPNEGSGNINQIYYRFYIQVKLILEWLHLCNSQPGILSVDDMYTDVNVNVLEYASIIYTIKTYIGNLGKRHILRKLTNPLI